jgi:hypothetical protein
MPYFYTLSYLLTNLFIKIFNILNLNLNHNNNNDKTLILILI